MLYINYIKLNVLIRNAKDELGFEGCVDLHLKKHTNQQNMNDDLLVYDRQSLFFFSSCPTYISSVQNLHTRFFIITLL